MTLGKVILLAWYFNSMGFSVDTNHRNLNRKNDLKNTLRGTLRPKKMYHILPTELCLDDPTSSTWKYTARIAISNAFRWNIVSFQNCCCAACSPRCIFSRFFTKLGRKPSFPSLSETTKRLKTQPIWHSHLGEPPDGHAGFICYINIQFIAKIRPFSLAVF